MAWRCCSGRVRGSKGPKVGDGKRKSLAAACQELGCTGNGFLARSPVGPGASCGRRLSVRAGAGGLSAQGGALGPSNRTTAPVRASTRQQWLEGLVEHATNGSEGGRGSIKLWLENWEGGKVKECRVCLGCVVQSSSAGWRRGWFWSNVRNSYQVECLVWVRVRGRVQLGWMPENRCQSELLPGMQPAPHVVDHARWEERVPAVHVLLLWMLSLTHTQPQ